MIKEVEDNYKNLKDKIKWLSKYDFHISNYGTIIVDIENGDNIFSLEIGKESIGYFSEFEGNTLHFQENLLLNNDKTIGQLKFDYNEFLMFAGYA